MAVIVKLGSRVNEENMLTMIKRVGMKPFAVVIFTLISALLPWVSRNLSGLNGLLILVVRSGIWSSLLEGLTTTPVLFVLMNCVILSIWISSKGSFSPINEWDHNNSDAEEIHDAMIRLRPVPAPASQPSITIRSSREFKCSSLVGDESFLINCKEEGKGIRIEALESLDTNNLGLRFSPESACSNASEANAKETTTHIQIQKQEAKANLNQSEEGIEEKNRVHHQKRKTRHAVRRNNTTTAVHKHADSDFKVNFQSRASSFSAAVSPGMVIRDVTNAELGQDELNDRIEAFFANFYQQLKLQSLQDRGE